jgi:RNA polymerase sigma factor (sigma-70 family)
MEDYGSGSSDYVSPDFAGALREARRGDQAAWGILFNECYPKLLRVVDRRLDRSLRSLYDSADFASEAMKSLVVHFDGLQFQSIKSLMDFLVHVAKHKIIDEYRRRNTIKRSIRRGRRVSARDSGPYEPYSDEPTPDQLVEASEFRERLRSLFDEGARTAVVLRQQGYSSSDIAERIGWGIRKVQRVFKKLRDSMEDSSHVRHPRANTQHRADFGTGLAYRRVGPRRP